MMALTGTAAAPSCLLLLLAFLPSWDTQIRPQRKPHPGRHILVLSRQNVKQLITLLERQIQILHQRHLMLEHELHKKQGKPETVRIKVLKGSFVKEKATPSSLKTQETPFPNSFSVLAGNKLHKNFPNILIEAPGRHNKVKGAGTKEDMKERTLLSGLKQDKNADDNGGRSVRTTLTTLNFHSADNASKTQFDIYNLKDSREIPEVHIVTSNITSQGFKMDSVESKDGGMQVVKNSSMNKKVKHVPEKGRRKVLLKLDRGITGKSTTEDSKRNLPVTVLKPLKVIYMEKPTRQPLFFEESNPTVTGGKDRSQSLIRQQAELSVEVLEKILCYLKKEKEMQKSLSPYEKMQSSIMENILQELKEHKAPGEADSSEDKLEITLKPFPGESSTVPVSDELSLKQAQTTTVPNITEVTNEDVMGAQRLEEYEGVQDKKRAKAADLRDLLKDIIIACVAITGLILAVIVLLHICISLFVKKKQEPVKGEPDKNKVTAVQKKGTQTRGDNTKNNNNNNLTFVDEKSADGEFVAENEDIVEPLKTQPAEYISSCGSPSRETHILLPAKLLQELPGYYSPSYNSTHENLGEHFRTFKTSPISCNRPEHFEKPENHGYKRLQEKDTAPYRKDSNNQRPFRHKSKSTEPKRICTTCSSKHCCYCSSSWVMHFSSAPVTLDINENINESRLSQHDGSQCACFQFQKGSSCTDSYSD